MTLVLELTAVVAAAVLLLRWVRRTRAQHVPRRSDDWVDTAADISTRQRLRRHKRR
jgi:hypothetical protein